MKSIRRPSAETGSLHIFSTTEYKAHKDPLAEDAFIYFGPGPLNGTFCVSTRTSFAHMSPYTGLISHAETGAHFGNEIKWAGWDGIYIKGRSKKPVWLSIVDDKVEFKDATKIWGKDTEETHEANHQGDEGSLRPDGGHRPGRREPGSLLLRDCGAFPRCREKRNGHADGKQEAERPRRQRHQGCACC